MLDKDIIELSSNPSFWYLVSFVLFLIISLRPILTLCNNLIRSKQDNFAKQLADAHITYTDAQAYLRKADITIFDLAMCINEIQDQADHEVKRLYDKMYQQLDEYKAYHKVLLQQKLKNFEAEKMYQLKDAYIRNMVVKIKDDINSKMNKATDHKVCEYLIDKLIN